MGGRALRPREVVDDSKRKAKPAQIKIEHDQSRIKAPRRKADPLCENELDVDPWLENGDWSRLFADPVLAAVRAAKSREEWENKVAFCVGQMALHIRHVPGHRVPELMAYFQPTTNGVVHAAGERPFFERKLKELQCELSAGFETVSRMFLATQAGKEYVEAFWKAKAQKHKPKWVTPEVIEGGITITEVEICALWAPISLACGSGWFLDENLKARMVTFVPIMKKQTYWILARFIRALTLTKETDMDLSVETRQEIFLYSSKMDLFPAFPAPNGGYPRTPDEWMTVSPYYKSAMETDEMKAFMKRYGYKTTAIKLEEERAAKEAKMEQVRKEKEERERDKEVAIQKQREYQLQLACEKNVEGHGENAQVLCIEAAAVALAEDMVPRDDVTDDGVGFNINADAREVMAEAKIGVGTIDGAEVKVVGKAREQLGKTEGQASGVVEVFSSDADGGDESTPGASNTSADGDSEDYVSDEDDNPADFSTSMMVEANTQMTEDDYMNCQDEEATFFQKVQDIKEVLEFAGMRNWKDECLRALVLSGPIGICMWSMRLMSRLRHEIQRATVMLKQLDDATLAAQNKLKEEREQRRKDLEVWSKLQAQTHLHMDGLVQMRKEDLHSKGNAGDEISGGIFFGGGGAEASNGKRRSAYPDGRKSVYPDGQKRQKKAKSVMRNPFETPLRVGTPIGTQNVSTTIPKVGTPSDTPGERSDTMM